MDTVKDTLKAYVEGLDDAHIERKLPESYEVLEESEWTQDHKYQTNDVVIQHTESGRTFMAQQTRSGSYHTDWYYSAPHFMGEVKKVTETVTIEKWVST